LARKDSVISLFCNAPVIKRDGELKKGASSSAGGKKRGAFFSPSSFTSSAAATPTASSPPPATPPPPRPPVPRPGRHPWRSRLPQCPRRHSIPESEGSEKKVEEDEGRKSVAAASSAAAGGFLALLRSLLRPLSRSTPRPGRLAPWRRSTRACSPVTASPERGGQKK